MPTWKDHGMVGFRLNRETREAVEAFMRDQTVAPTPSQVCKSALEFFLTKKGYPCQKNRKVRAARATRSSGTRSPETSPEP